jgi:hypothetical protein
MSDPNICPWLPCGGVDCCEHGAPDCDDRVLEDDGDPDPDLSLSRLPESELGGW